MATLMTRPLLTLDGAAVLNEAGAAKFLGMSKSTLIRKREANEIHSIKDGKLRRYLVDDLAAYLARL